MEIVSTLAIAAAAIVVLAWLIRDDRIFWADCEKVAKGKNTVRYFTQFNKK